MLFLELAHSTSCKSRLLYLSLCQHVPEFFSKAFFKEYFYEATIGMAFVSTWFGDFNLCVDLSFIVIFLKFIYLLMMLLLYIYMYR